MSQSSTTRRLLRLKAVLVSRSGEGRLARATSWNIAGGAASRAFALAGSFLVARSLGEIGFGRLAMLLTTFTTLGVFASFGLGTTAIRYISICRTTDVDRAGRIATFAPAFAAIMGLVAVAALLLFTPWFAAFTLNDRNLAPLVQLAAPLLLLGAVQDSLQGVLSGLESFRALARSTTVSGSSLALGMVLGATLWDLRGCIIGLLMGMTFGCLFTYQTMRTELAKHGIPFKPDGWPRESSTLWRFAVPTFLSSIVVGPVNWLAMALLVHQPGGISQVGIFNAANQWRTAVLHIPILVASAGLPVLTHLWRTTSDGEYVRLIRLKVLVGFLISSAMAIPIMCLAPMIMSGYGEAFAKSGLVLIVLSGAAVIAATLTMIGQTLISEDRMWTGLTLNALWAVVLLATAYHWIPTHGALGLAWANLTAFGFHLITVTTYFILRHRKSYDR